MAGGVQRAPAFAPGERCGPYRIERLVAAGGIGDVYAGVHAVLGRKAAIKVLQQRYADRDDLAKRLELEARVLSQIRHPNMVSVYDAGVVAGDSERPDRVWMAMEFLEGTTLRSLVGHGEPLPIAQAITYCRDIALGVQAAHDAGAVHRDLKPENVMVCSDGRVVVLDLGTAKHLRGTQLRPTQRIIGTVAYMSPEHLLGEDLDGRADVYSLGLVLWEMCAGYHPFAKSRNTFDLPGSVELARMQIEVMPAPLRKVAPQVPKAVAKLVERALRKEAFDRFPDMGSFAAELTKLERSLGNDRQASGPAFAAAPASRVVLTGGDAALARGGPANPNWQPPLTTLPLQQRTLPLDGSITETPFVANADAGAIGSVQNVQSGHTLRISAEPHVPTEALSSEEQAQHMQRAAFTNTVRARPARRAVGDLPTRTAEPFAPKATADRAARVRRRARWAVAALSVVGIAFVAYVRLRPAPNDNDITEAPSAALPPPMAPAPAVIEPAPNVTPAAPVTAAPPSEDVPAEPEPTPAAAEGAVPTATNAPEASEPLAESTRPPPPAPEKARSAAAAPAAAVPRAVPPPRTTAPTRARPARDTDKPPQPTEPVLLPGMPSSGL